MSWIEKIRQKPREDKIRIIWAGAILAAILLIAVWAASSRINKNTARDTTLFQAVGRGVKDIKDNFKK